MHLAALRSKKLVISIILMMLCVQSFSLHAHLPDGDEGDHHSHAHSHSHILNDLHDTHLDLEHDEDTSSESKGTFSKQLPFFKYFVFIFLIIVPTALLVWNIRNTSQDTQRLRYLLLLRPPLRAPPL